MTRGQVLQFWIATEAAGLIYADQAIIIHGNVINGDH